MNVLHYKRLPVILLIAGCTLLNLQCSESEKPAIKPDPPSATATFSNPLQYGADPWVYLKDGIYYYLQTTGNGIRIWKTEYLSKLASATSRTVFSPVAGAANSQNIWAPELHFLDNKWYIYYTAGSGPDLTQRLWVLENSNPDPTAGQWTDRGRIISPATNFWAIDGTIFQLDGLSYLVWSGRPDLSGTDLTQNLYISRMINPWTPEPEATLISSPGLAWERNGFAVNEAPQSLKGPTGKQFIIYSASYCGTDDYALGMLTLKAGGDPLNATDWEKNPQPVFTKSPQSRAFGPGHNSFFKSPDGTEDWLIYHANSNSGEGCSGSRNIRIQKFTFNDAGTPIFPEPVPAGMMIPKPSGED